MKIKKHPLAILLTIIGLLIPLVGFFGMEYVRTVLFLLNPLAVLIGLFAIPVNNEIIAILITSIVSGAIYLILGIIVEKIVNWLFADNNKEVSTFLMLKYGVAFTIIILLITNFLLYQLLMTIGSVFV